MLNTTLRNGLMLLIWLCLIFSVRAEEVPFLAPQQRPNWRPINPAGGSLSGAGLP
ncbi:hypothetical protein KPZU09_46940 [Klebsiella pneumoniae]|uniref:Uncharacterized protein n=1 Tax=Klebsiella pneumoniae TaxID=573 RepID=A0A919LTN7_KLEPN|nr:hypothetical protein KPZU09_46940 [Klebsiella pneumoniae]